MSRQKELYIVIKAYTTDWGKFSGHAVYEFNDREDLRKDLLKDLSFLLPENIKSIVDTYDVDMLIKFVLLLSYFSGCMLYDCKKTFNWVVTIIANGNDLGKPILSNKEFSKTSNMMMHTLVDVNWERLDDEYNIEYERLYKNIFSIIQKYLG